MKFIPLNKWLPHQRPIIIAGPCSAESEEQMLKTAKSLELIEAVKVFRAGIWKPRTRPYTFEGVGEEGLAWLKKVKEQTRLLTTTEVANAQHVELALKYDVDILWIGARTTVNPFSVQEIADALRGTDIPVMVKNPINVDLALWMGALERMSAVGLNKLVAIHRGFSSGEKTRYRNQPLWKIPMELKRRCPDLPLICDPSHIAGRRDMIAEVSQWAMDLDMDGLMIETHPNPDKALSDADQQITPDQLNEIISRLSLRSEYSSDRTFKSDLENLRAKIDRIDNEILEALKVRQEVVGKIGQAKAKNNITALQVHRMDVMINSRKELGKALNLSEKFISEIFEAIHAESVRLQTKIFNETNSSDD